MAELNWIPKEERLPTKEDANEDQLVYAICSGRVKTYHWKNIGVHSYPITHWLPFSEMPVPKLWRIPTIHDLAKAGKPIPCRMRDCEKRAWLTSALIAISVAECERPFYCTETRWRYCEICDE